MKFTVLVTIAFNLTAVRRIWAGPVDETTVLTERVIEGNGDYYLQTWYRNEDGLKCTERCEPGTFLVEECSSSEPTKCKPCEQGTYTEEYNTHRRCMTCDECEPHYNFGTASECKPDKNTMCKCAPGHWHDDANMFCHPYTRCGEGYEIAVTGTSVTDNICTKCKAGFFSNSMSGGNKMKRCLKHKDCPDGVMRSGNKVMDSVCKLKTDDLVTDPITGNASNRQGKSTVLTMILSSLLVVMSNLQR